MGDISFVFHTFPGISRKWIFLTRPLRGSWRKVLFLQSVRKWQFEYNTLRTCKHVLRLYVAFSWSYDVRNTGQRVSQSVVRCRKMILQCMILGGQNRQSPVASVQRKRSTLARHSALPRGTNVTRMNTNRAMRAAAQQTNAGSMRTNFCVLAEIWLPTTSNR